jgi:hypothetical protein
MSCGCGVVDAHKAMGMGIGANRGGEGVSVDDDFTTGTVIELENDVGVDTEEEVTELRLSFGDLSCNGSEM